MWPAVVEAGSGGKLRLLNEGKGGRPTASVEEFAKAAERHAAAKVEVVLIALGTNDSRDVSAECVPKAVANVRRMVGHARKALGPDVRVLLVGPPNIRKDALGPTRPIADQRDQKLRELGAAFEALAREEKCDFVSLYGAVAPESLSRDGVHPDKAGNEAIARVIAPKLRGMVP